MSTVTEEKPKAQPKPLGSFLTKLTPKPVVKPVEKAVEKPAEARNEGTNEGRDGGVGGKDTGSKDTGVGANDAGGEARKDAPAPEAVQADKPKDDKTEKRLKDAQTWGNEEHKARLDAERRNTELQAQLQRIEAKLDGTYEEPAAPSIEQARVHADMTGRIRASHKAAVRLHGEPFVMETVWNTGSPYQELVKRDPRIEARVMEADDPVLEAIAVVKEHQDGVKYGRTPEEIRKNIEAELAPQLEKKIIEGLKTKPGAAVNTLSNARGGTERTEQKNDAPTKLDFRQVFPWGASRR